MNINESVRQAVSLKIEQLMKDYKEDIETAYNETEKTFSISFPVKLSAGSAGVIVETGISFTAKKIKDSSIVEVA